jgi:hypothetical protein
MTINHLRWEGQAAKLAKDIRPGDTVFLQDGRAVKVMDVGPGLWRGSVLIDFAQPKTGERVGLTFHCTDRDTPQRGEMIR